WVAGVPFSALSVSTTALEMAAAVDGMNSMPSMQLNDGDRNWPLLQELFPPCNVKLADVVIWVMFSVSLPRFSIPTSCAALAVPTNVLGKVRDGGSETSTLRMRSLNSSVMYKLPAPSTAMPEARY